MERGLGAVPTKSWGSPQGGLPSFPGSHPGGPSQFPVPLTEVSPHSRGSHLGGPILGASPSIPGIPSQNPSLIPGGLTLVPPLPFLLLGPRRPRSLRHGRAPRTAHAPSPPSRAASGPRRRFPLVRPAANPAHRPRASFSIRCRLFVPPTPEVTRSSIG